MNSKDNMLGTGKVNKDSPPGSFISKKMVENMKLDFRNVSFRHNSAYIIQKGLKVKRVVITFRLSNIS